VNLWSGAGRGGGSRQGAAQDPAEQAVLLAVIIVSLVAALALAAGHVSAFLFEGGWPSYPAGEIPGILGRAVTHPLDPGSAWDDVNEGTAVPGPVAWWFTFLVLAAGIAVPIVLALRSDERNRSRSREVAGIAAPTQKDLRRMQIEREDPSELVVGTADGHEVALKSCHSLLVIGPARSGKTSAVTIPAVLEWPGPVVATSTAGDLVDHTIGWRSRQGDVHVFDPMGTTSYTASGWSPLASCTTWNGATRTAWDLAMAGKASIGTGSGVGEFWFSSAARSLAPYLFAAAESSRTMEDVARWIDAEERDEVLAELRTVNPDAAVAHAATFRREDAARASLFHVMQQIVGAYLDPKVAASAQRHEIECNELLDGGPHTLYITAPYHDQARVRPLFAALVRQVLGAVHDRVSKTRKPLDAPLLLILDDAANIAPVEDLPTLAATSAAAGIQVVTVFQDHTQIEIRHGQDAPAVLANHRAKLLLPGSGGVDAIDLAERISEDVGAGPLSTTSRRALAPELARQIPSDEAVLVYDDRAPIRVKLRHWHKSRELRRRSGVAQDAIAPTEGRRAPAFTPLIENAPPASDGPIVNPLPTPSAVDPAAFDDVDPDTYLVPPHFPSNVSPLSAARDRLRRRKTPDTDGG
jgi:type IV secretion system protein VirD4